MRQSLTTHPTHPKTGKVLGPVGYRSDGRPIFPILGAAEDDDDTSGSNDDADDDADDDDADDDDSGDEDDSDDDDDKAGKDGSKSGDDSELAKVKERMKAADRRASKAEAELKKIADAKKDDLTKANDNLKEVTAERDTLQTENAGLRMQVAFLSANTHSWAKPKQALTLAQTEGYLDGVVDEDDGTIDDKALKKALNKFAEDNKHLLKSSDGEDDEDERPPSGSNVGSQKKKKKGKDLDKEALRRKYPALRS